jgi:hypothetical protein
MSYLRKSGILAILLVGLMMSLPGVNAATDCSFTTAGNVMTLNGSCTTDATLYIPDGFTLDGAGYSITAVDPAGGHFIGGVVQNAGTSANVTNLTVTASGLANVCDDLPYATRLSGIHFNNASGSITYSTLTGINQGPSGCQEGVGIWLDGGGNVEVAHNTIVDYQKSGIVVLPSTIANIHHNDIGASATQNNLAANAVQISTASVVMHNHISGNQWTGPGEWAGTAVLVFYTDNATVSQNNLRGSADVGIYIIGNYGFYDNNRVFEEGVDGPYGDYGIIDYYGDLSGTSQNTITNNKVRGYEVPYVGVTDGKNKTIPGANPVDH